MYADDILLMSHTVRSVQMMLQIRYEFADHFDVEFNISKSVAMRIGNRYSERCISLQIAGKDIKYVNESKYLDVCVIAVKYLKFSVEYLRQKFTIRLTVLLQVKAANSEMVTVQLLTSYCLPFMMYCVSCIFVLC